MNMLGNSYVIKPLCIRIKSPFAANDWLYGILKPGRLSATQYFILAVFCTSSSKCSENCDFFLMREFTFIKAVNAQNIKWLEYDRGSRAVVVESK